MRRAIRRGTATAAAATVILLLVSMTGCSTLFPLTAAPEYAHLLEPEYTVDIPEETPASAADTSGMEPDERVAVTVYSRNQRSVVNVTGVSVYRGLLGATYPSGSTGSGFVFDTVGHVVTNNHVIADSQRVYVTMYDGSNYPASVVGADVELDIAVLYVDFLGREVAPVEFGPSGRLQVGQTVFALGNPYGLEGTLTRGLVSGLRRPMETESGFIVQNLIQTDAAINPGNSGGPLISSDGRVVGMNVMLVSPTGSNVGIGFAIPSDTFVRMAEQIIDEGRVTKGWIDIHGVALNSALAATAGLSVTNGLLVTRVIDGGNADRAGLVDGSRGRTVMRGGIPIPVEGDVIVAIDSQPITTLADYLGALQTTQPGDVVELTVVRDGQTRMVTVELVARAQSSGKAQ